ncbi:11537_t:CDS:2 [Rhizophagus irregularis]|nr:11537_t:CDS:2 [Rhizophagus irregularis]
MEAKNGKSKDDSIDNGTSIGDQLDQFIDERIVLNVGGVKYETYRSTLTAHPKTFLGTMFHPRNQAMLHPVNGNEYFIDRNGHAFHYIMEYYRTGNIVWRPSPELPFENTTPSSNSSTTTISSINSVNNNGTHADHNNVIVPTVLRRRHQCSHSSSPPIYPPYTSLPELEQEFSYFGIPFTSPLPIAQKAGGALLDEFAYSIEDLICTAIAKLIDRVSITFFRDGSPMECFLIQSIQSQSICSNRSTNKCSTINCSGCNRRCNNCNTGGAKLIEFSLNGYCIVNHFYEDIRKYLENVFPNMVFRLEFGNNYKSITMSMSGLFTRNAIQKYSKIGKLNNSSEED